MEGRCSLRRRGKLVTCHSVLRAEGNEANITHANGDSLVLDMSGNLGDRGYDREQGGEPPLLYILLCGILYPFRDLKPGKNLEDKIITLQILRF